MKKLLCVLALFILAFASCSPEDETPTDPVMDDFEPSPAATVIGTGTFEGVAHKVTGEVKIYENGNNRTLVLDPFSTENGPDLYVYLTSDPKASKYASLGKLRSTTGKQSYELAGDIVLDDYSYVIIWCKEFSVNFGNAEIK